MTLTNLSVPMAESNLLIVFDFNYIETGEKIFFTKHSFPIYKVTVFQASPACRCEKCSLNMETNVQQW